MNKTILSIDCGTQSLRALLFGLDGQLINKVQISYKPYESPKPGWAEQDPLVFWNSLIEASQKLKALEPDNFAAIAGVGVTTQRDSMVNVDKEGNPLRPVITWLDQRKSKQVYFPNFIMKTAYKAVGMYESLLKLQYAGKCNWIRQNEPEIWAKTHKYLEVSGYLNFKLTNKFVDSVASQIGHHPFDYKKMRWASKNNLSTKMFPIEREKLAEVVEPGAPIGAITKEAAQATGIAENIPVIACGSDKGCETVGMGVMDTSMASLSFGTTATIQTTTKKYFEPLKYMPAYPAALPKHYNPEVEIFRGYWMITWFKNEFGHKEMETAEQLGLAPEEVLNDLLEQVPAGSMGLMLQPYWGPGLKTPCAKGAMIGFGEIHTRAHVYKAVIEGLGYALREGLIAIEKSGHTKIERLAVSGGASQSDQICQISADIFNRPLVKGRTHETSGLGAAIITAVGIGEHASFQEATDKMVVYGKTFMPNPEHVKIYNQLFNRVYKKMFPTLKHIYKEIRDITNYPEKIRT